VFDWFVDVVKLVDMHEISMKLDLFASPNVGQGRWSALDFFE
jgi:hypothetical protein